MPKLINIERMEEVVDDGHCQLVVANELRHLPAYQNGNGPTTDGTRIYALARWRSRSFISFSDQPFDRTTLTYCSIIRTF